MNDANKDYWGNSFERILVALLAIGSGLMLIFLSIEGPLFLHQIKYKTAEVINNQIEGQDIVNLFILSTMLLVGGITLFLKKRISKYLIIMSPVYLIYFVLSYTIGLEWSSPSYTGNSEHYTYHFMFILISALIMLLYSLSVFPKNFQGNFKKKGLTIYSVVYSMLLILFALMWVKEVNQVIQTGTSRGYEIAPTAFWVVRYFDLGFTIPLGIISIYLLWTRPDESYPVQLLFYGFFLTMVVAVNTMSLFMYLNNDPTFDLRGAVIFLCLFVIIFTGFVFIVRNYKITKN